MALADLIATHGGAFQSSYLKSQQEHRAQQAHGLQQQMRGQQVEQNQMKLEAQQQQVEQQEQQKEILRNYKGDKRGLVDTFLQEGDMEAALQMAQLGIHTDKLDANKKAQLEDDLAERNEKSLQSADIVLQEYEINPTAGRKIYAEEYTQMLQDPEMKDMVARMPDPNSASDEEILQFSRTRRNRSMTYQKFDLEKQKAEKPSGGKKQKLNLHWPGLPRPVKGQFDPGTGQYTYESSPGVWANAPTDAQVVSTGIQGTSKDVLGMTKSNITDLNRQLKNDEDAIGSIKSIISGVEKSPGAVGFVGAISEVAAGLTGQFGATGEQISLMLESDDESQVRTGMRMLTAVLIPRVTGDTSGRYSDRDMERVDDVNRGLKPTSSKRQTVNALKVVLDVYERGYKKTQERLGKQSATTDSPVTPTSKYSNLWENPQ